MGYSKDFTLHGYYDASHSDDPNHSRSVSGILCMFAGGRVTWSAKKQPMVALSSCKSFEVFVIRDFYQIHSDMSF